ncbi:MAG: hypothetical protein Fur0011_3580 [Candidatus Microgenomates bacterium]
MVLTTIDNIRWNPEHSSFPDGAKFLFVTSALGKIRGLAKSGLQTPFVAWSPEGVPPEPEHLTLDRLIIKKAETLALLSSEQLQTVFGFDVNQIPKNYLVQDVYPTLGHPGASGGEHLVKPKEVMGYDNLVKFIASPWIKYQNNPVTVQLASAFAMVNRYGKQIGCRSIIQDSVNITYSKNPFTSVEEVSDYIEYVKGKRFQGFSRADLVVEFCKIAGGVFHEYLYLWARERGIEVNTGQKLSCEGLSAHELIYSIGAAGITPAIVGWIDKQAKLKLA